MDVANRFGLNRSEHTTHVLVDPEGRALPGAYGGKSAAYADYRAACADRAAAGGGSLVPPYAPGQLAELLRYARAVAARAAGSTMPSGRALHQARLRCGQRCG